MKQPYVLIHCLLKTIIETAKKDTTMKNLLFITILCLGIIINTNAQSSIKGKVSDANSPLGFVNVVLQALPDSNIVTVRSTNIDGKYAFDNLENGNYFLAGLMLSYEDLKSESFELKDETIELDMVMIEKTNIFGTVEITAKVPLMEQRADKLVINVARSLTSVSGSLLDVMKKVPGMIVVNGKLRMPGNSNPTIYINGRSTQYLDMESLLREMPSDNIEKIEVITQPGAEYEAAGTGPIINIVLKNNRMYGINGSVFIGGGKGETWKKSGGVNLSYRQGLLNLYGGVGYSNNKNNERFFLDRVIGDTHYASENLTPYDPKTLRVNAGIDYYITDNQEIGISVKRTKSNGDRTQTNLSNILSPIDEDVRNYTTRNDVDRSWEFISADAYYTVKLDTMGQKLEFDANVSRFDNNKTNIITSEEMSARSNNFLDTRYNQPGKTNFWVGKIDYTLPLSRAIELKTGGKYTDASIDNNFKSEFFKESIWNENTNESNHYLFDETIAAVYAKLNMSFGDWNMTAGLRYEDSKSTGYSITLDSTTARGISQIFPSASISRKVAGPISAALAYSYRINRPSYTTLNPFVLALDPLTSEKGNTMLRPELTHSGKFTLTYEGQPFFNLEYKDTRDVMVYVTEQNDATGQASAQTVNLDRLNNYSGMIVLPFDMFLPFSGYIGTIANYASYDSDYLGERFDRSKLAFTSFIQMNFNLPWDVTLEASGWHQSGGQDGIIDYGQLFGTELGVQKKFLEDKLSVNLSWSDPISRYWNGNLNYANMQATMQSTWEVNVVEARISYKFGNQHLKKKQKREGGASSVIRRASDDK
ncbi:MAG: ferric enterobactin receptor [Saprospiraceae bacterium]|jgi:hypothetical protein